MKRDDDSGVHSFSELHEARRETKFVATKRRGNSRQDNQKLINEEFDPCAFLEKNSWNTRRKEITLIRA